MLVSIAIPCYKSAKTLPTVINEIEVAFSNQEGFDYQVIMVNDGSPDEGETFRVIRELCSSNDKLFGIDLSKNYGQSAARMAALPLVKGDVLVYMDDDGQHNPNDIFKLLEAINEGNDAVYAFFQHKAHGFSKRAGSWLNGLIINKALGKPPHLHTSSFCAFSRFIIDRLKEYKAPRISFLGFILQHTSRVVNVPIEHHDRISGSSGYTLKKSLALFKDGIFYTPDFIVGIIGKLSLLSFVCASIFFCLGVVFLFVGIDAWTCVVLFCMFFCSALLLLGLRCLGEFIGKTWASIISTPLYSIRTVITPDNNNRAEEKGNA